MIVDAVGEGILTVTEDGVVRHCNPAAGRVFGCRPTQAIGRGLERRLFDPAHPDQPTNELLSGLVSRLGDSRHELTGRHRDGSEFPVEAMVTRTVERGRPLFVVVIRDIGGRAAMLAKLRRAAAVFETTTDGIVVLDRNWRIEAVNPAFTTITGYAGAEVIGHPPAFLTTKKSESGLIENIAETLEKSGRWDREHRGRRKSGEAYSERVTITGIRDEHGLITGYVVALADVTQRRQDEERVRYQANYDSLTGLPNRGLFMDRLTQAVNAAERSAHRVAVMFIDLDGFKLVNDTLGHDVGDELLREAARRLNANVRAGDTVARVGGDEFTVVMPNLANLHPAPVVAQRIISSLEQPFRFENQEALVSASIGITVFPDDARDIHALLRNADAAMYQAKEQGKASYRFYTADLNAQATERLAMKNGLAKALKRGEIDLEYQLRRELATGRPTGVEALLRWNSRDLGEVPPSKFIPVAEETGVIVAIGEWALATACRRQKHWRELGFANVRVAVNLSSRQLRQPNIVRIVASILEREDAQATGLEIEITEAMIMRDADHSAATLKSLADLGIRITLDDFGTGYSSLSVLKRFPVDNIKIDQSLVRDIAGDAESLEILRAIISMGHSLRRRVIAEGVENEDQARRLGELQCDEIQGFLVGPPVAAESMDRMLIAARQQIHA